MAKQTFTTGQVLTANQMSSLQQTAMLGGAASAKTASYTLVAADAGTAISMSNASATTITVNTALFAAGDTVQITNLGVGVCTITAGTATVNTSASLALAQYESGTLDFTSTSAAIFIKGAGAAAAGGGMTLLSTTSLTGASTTISSIDQTYNNLFVVISGVTNATADGNFALDPNSDNTLTYDVYSRGATFNNGAAESLFLNYFNTYQPLRTSNVNTWALLISNYASTTTRKPYNYTGGYTTSVNLYPTIGYGIISTTTAISALKFSNSGGNLSTGTVLVYGVK